MSHTNVPDEGKKAGKGGLDPLKAAMIAGLVVVVAWVVNLKYGQTLPATERGVFGDMFGAANSIFSGLAFIGVIYAVFLQRQEVAVAREEISYTKEILEDQKGQLTLQNTETRRQMFESTFFQMLRLFTDITQQIDLQRTEGASQVITKGKDVFPVFLKRLRNEYNPPAKAFYGEHDFQAAYEAFYQEHNSELGHYFRTIYNIVKFVDRSEMENKNFYTNILRAQLSDAEVGLLFHNGLSPRGRAKFKPLIEKYGLLKNVSDQDILDIALKEQYEKSAFGKQFAMTPPTC